MICLLAAAIFAQVPVQNGVFALQIMSFNDPVKGKCSAYLATRGTAFFIDKKTIITAYHVLNPSVLKPEAGKKHFRVWLTSPVSFCSLLGDKIEFYPKYDLSVIRLGFVSDAPVLSLEGSRSPMGLPVKAYGYPFDPPKVTLSGMVWSQGQPVPNVPQSLMPQGLCADGHITERVPFNETSVRNRLKGSGIRYGYGAALSHVKTSAYVIVGSGGKGMSGGPVMSDKDKAVVVGMTVSGQTAKGYAVLMNDRSYAIPSDVIARALKERPDSSRRINRDDR